MSTSVFFQADLARLSYGVLSQIRSGIFSAQDENGIHEVFKKIRLVARQAKRVGAFSGAIEKGMSAAEARAYSDALYPPTPEDIAYEKECRREMERKTTRAAQVDDPLLGRADILVQSARLNATAMFTTLLKEGHPRVGEAKTEDWDFFVTVASVYAAATGLQSLRLGEVREQKLLNKVFERLHQWEPRNTVRAYDDCRSFFLKECDGLKKKGHDPQYIAPDALGLWINWNVFGRPPQTDDEVQLTRLIGVITANDFFNWWKE